MDLATDVRCAICGTVKGPDTKVEWLHCPTCGIVYCAPCAEEARHEQWKAGEAATVSCRTCGGILLTTVED